jgi:hypothetical protein
MSPPSLSYRLSLPCAYTGLKSARTAHGCLDLNGWATKRSNKCNPRRRPQPVRSTKGVIVGVGTGVEIERDCST